MSRSTTEAKARAVGNPSPAYPPILAPVPVGITKAAVYSS